MTIYFLILLMFPLGFFNLWDDTWDDGYKQSTSISNNLGLLHRKPNKQMLKNNAGVGLKVAVKKLSILMHELVGDLVQSSSSSSSWESLSGSDMYGWFTSILKLTTVQLIVD